MADASKWTQTSASGPATEGQQFLPRAAGKVIIVTGAGSGIGQATAIRLAAEGGTVACADLFGETAQKTVDISFEPTFVHNIHVARDRSIIVNSGWIRNLSEAIRPGQLEDPVRHG